MIGNDFDKGIYTIKCHRCGTYRATDNFAQDFPNERRITPQQKALLSGYVREKELNHERILLTSENYLNIIKSDPLVPKNALDKTIKLLKYFHNNSIDFGQRISLNSSTDCSLTYSRSFNETQYITQELIRQGYIEFHHLDSPQTYTITFAGENYLAKLEKEKYIASKQLFAALGFNSQLKEILDAGQFKGAIKEKTGYEIMTIDKKEHVNKICDEIIAEINKSRAIIVDVTDGNQGAYYEGGYAHGLGIPVIYVCKDDVNGKGEKLIDLVHFDTRQYSHILWKDEADLIIQLSNKINAVLGRLV
jgi:nucleoside 2-deoxyribosyltransferase